MRTFKPQNSLCFWQIQEVGTRKHPQIHIQHSERIINYSPMNNVNHRLCLCTHMHMHMYGHTQRGTYMET